MNTDMSGREMFSLPETEYGFYFFILESKIRLAR